MTQPFGGPALRRVDRRILLGQQSPGLVDSPGDRIELRQLPVRSVEHRDRRQRVPLQRVLHGLYRALDTVAEL